MRGIYGIINKVNRKIYVGKAEDIIQRFKRHIRELNQNIHKNKHLQAAYNKYGNKNFEFVILDVLDKNDDLNEREIYRITQYQAYDTRYGYNRTKGGDGGNSYYELMSDEEKKMHNEKQSKRMSGENNPLYGKHMYTNGEHIIYISNDQIEEFEKNGWYKGVPEYVRENERKANMGEQNGFYGKKHSNETRKYLSEMRTGNKNWNYNKHIYHKGNEQKYISEDEIALYMINGWKPGLADYVKENISKKNKGKTQINSHQNAIKYMYQNQIFYGWRQLREYLRAIGYPTISETTILKLTKGKIVKGYDDLINQINIVTE